MKAFLLLTPLEKLLSPFDHETWILIASTLLTTFVFIQIISFVSNNARNFIFGTNIQSPTMNLLNIFFCGNQAKAPKDNFARFLFWTFLVWGLIIRTCYQSLSYRDLQSDMRHSPTKSFEELASKNFTQIVGDLKLEGVENYWLRR